MGDITNNPGEGKLTPVRLDGYPSYLRYVIDNKGLVWPRAGTGATRVAAGPAAARSLLGSAGGTLAGYCKHRKLGCKLLALAFRAFRLFAAINNGLKLVIALFTDVFKNRHEKTPLAQRTVISI
jgi:hypothetical protein